MIDINRKDLYRHDQPEYKERTRKRLQEISDMGMEECGVAEFGIKDVMSGLYIENVWSFSNEKWNDYIAWTKELVKVKCKSNLVEIPKSQLIEAAKIAEQKIKNAIKEATASFPNHQNEIAFVIHKEPLGELSVKFMVDLGRIKLID